MNKFVNDLNGAEAFFMCIDTNDHTFVLAIYCVLCSIKLKKVCMRWKVDVGRKMDIYNSYLENRKKIEFVC